MKKTLFILLSFLSIKTFSQDKIEKLNYAKIEIEVPKNCQAKSEYEIIDCEGFSAQWIFLSDEMVQQKFPEKVSKQIEQQFNYSEKKELKFISQNQKFQGTAYRMKDGEYRIIGFGKINEIYLILNLGFAKEPKSNSDLTEFQKNFINL